MAKYYFSIEQIKQANYDACSHFFDKATMRFFKSRVLDGVYGGRYFITSERNGPHPRWYTIREIRENGSIHTVGEFQEYATARHARRAIERMLREKGE